MRRNSLIFCLGECKKVQLLWKRVWQFHKRSNIEVPFDPAIPLLVYTWEKSSHMTCPGIKPATSWCMVQCLTTESHQPGASGTFLWNNFQVGFLIITSALSVDAVSSLLPAWTEVQVLRMSCCWGDVPKVRLPDPVSASNHLAGRLYVH